MLAKILLYAATFGAAGGSGFLEANRVLLAGEDRRRIRRWLLLCVLAAAILSVVRVLVLAGALGGGLAPSGALLRMVLRAGEGRAAAARLAGLLCMGTALRTERRSILLVVGAMLAASSFAWTGHAWAAPNHDLSITLLVVHLLCIGFWLGALVPLLLIVRGNAGTLAAVTERFGRTAVRVVPLLLLAGALLTIISVSIFGAPNSVLHEIQVASITLLISLVMLAIADIGEPFRGWVHIDSLPFARAQANMPLTH